MRKQVVVGMLAVLAGTTLASRTAAAQEQSGTSTQFSLGGGVDLPMGNFDNAANTGWHGLAALTFTPATWPVGIQIDGNYGRFPDDTPLDENLQMIFGTGNIVYRFQTSPESTFRPYLIGGGGVYNLKPTGNDVPDAQDSSTKFGHQRRRRVRHQGWFSLAVRRGPVPRRLHRRPTTRTSSPSRPASGSAAEPPAPDRPVPSRAGRMMSRPAGARMLRHGRSDAAGSRGAAPTLRLP